MSPNWRSPRARTVLLALGFGLTLTGFAGMCISLLPAERTITYNGPLNGSLVIGEVPGRIGWTGGGYIWAEFNATGGTPENGLGWHLEPGVWGVGLPNCSISEYPLPRDKNLDIVLYREWGGEGPNVSAVVHWRVTGMNPELFLPSAVAFIAGLATAAMGRKRTERLLSTVEFEERVKL